MKRIYSLLSVVSAIMLSLSMQGCEADVDMNNLDTSIEVDAKIATPIASMHATLGDFVGNGQWGIYVENGVLTFKDTFSTENKFHDLDLSQYISSTTLKMNVYEKLKNAAILQNGQITGNNQQIALEFPLTLKLDGINDAEKISTQYQRLDSALIKNASFKSTITTTGGLPLDWSWIDKVTISMDKNRIRRANGNIVTVYQKGDGYGYNQEIPINIDEFYINLMKDKNMTTPETYWNNVVDTCNFLITMYVTIPTTAGIVQIPANAGFQYDLNVTFIDYEAIWGMFQASSDMSDEQEIILADEWSTWKDLQSAKLPFSDPSVNLLITTEIAGALELTGEYLYAKDGNDQAVYASFSGNRTLYKAYNPEECLPLSSEIGESKTIGLLFDKDYQRGEIDKLFAIHPEKLGYKFSLDFNRFKTPQIRITNNTTVAVDAVCNLPFIFNEGVVLDYSDTIRGIDLTDLNIDSLLADVEIIDSLETVSATLALTFTNDIPFQIKGVFTCLDENNNVVIDPKTEKPLQLTGTDTVLIPSPKYTLDNRSLTWSVKEGDEGVKVETILADKNYLETLAKVKTIAFYALMDDQSLSDVFAQGASSTNFAAKLTEKEGLTVKISVGANIEAVLKLNSSDK